MQETDRLTDRTRWLAVPLDEKERAVQAGGTGADGRNNVIWHKEYKLWYARPGTPAERIAPWLPDPNVMTGGAEDPREEFAKILHEAGFVLDGLPVMDGKRHRVRTIEDRPGKKNGSGVYCGFLDRRPGGWFINFQRADTEKDITRWKAEGGTSDPHTLLHLRASSRQAMDDAAVRLAELHARQTAKAQGLYKKTPGATDDHAYLQRKGVSADPALHLTSNGALIIPISDHGGQLRTLQYIPPEGEKVLFTDAPKKGHFFVTGGALQNGQPVLFAEGYATARSLHMATGLPVVMTVDAGNMREVAPSFRQQYPDSPLVFMADLDHAKKENKGLKMATAAAESVTHGIAVAPVFTPDEIRRGLTDFNDLHQSRGLEGLRAYLHDALPVLQHTRTEEMKMNTPEEERGHTAEPPLMPEAPPPASMADYYDGTMPPDDDQPDEIATAVTHAQTVDTPAPEPEASVIQAQPQTPGVDDPDRHDAVTLPDPPEATPEPRTAQQDEAARQASTGSTPEGVTPQHGEPDIASLLTRPAAELPGADNRAPSALNTAAGTATVATEPQETPVIVTRPAGVQEAEAEPENVTADSHAARPADASSQKAASETPEAETENGFIFTPRPPDAADSAPERLDPDGLMQRITWEEKNSTVQYLLDGKPAFVDHGNRMTMSGTDASNSDEAVLAAILTAARHYGGKLEITGSEAFKEKVTGLIASYDLKVTMKNPVQQAMLDDARQKRLSEQHRDSVQASPLTPADMPQPAEAARHATSGTSPAPRPSDSTAADPAATRPVSKGSPYEDFKEGVKGKILEHGKAPYEFDASNKESYFIRLQTRAGEKTLWGVELATAIKESRVSDGQVITLQHKGKKQVTVQQPKRDGDGRITGYTPVQAHRNQWSITPAVTPGVRPPSAPTTGETLAACDMSVFQRLQTGMLKALPAEGIPPLPAQRDNLLWLRANGQGTTERGDPETARRPEKDPEAGKPVLSAWTQDGRLSLHLIKSDGPYLQGVALIGDTYHHVLASMPGGEKGGLVVNALTRDGLKYVGHGTAINKVEGKPVVRDALAFKLSGDTEPRIARLESPDKLPAPVHARLGFDERWKPDSELPKSQPRSEHHQKVQPGTGRPG